MVLFSILNILVSFLQGMYATSSTDLFLETSQKYGGFRYKKNNVFELPKMVGWNLWWIVLFSVLDVLVSFLQGMMYTTGSQVPKNEQKETYTK